MIPDNELSTEPIPSRFLSPDNLYYGPYQDAELGGVALGDASQGMSVQVWNGEYDPDTKTATLTPTLVPIPTTIFTRTDTVTCFSFCFDQNMLWQAVVCTTDGDAFLYWYDSLIAARTITQFSGVRNARLSLDDKRPVSLATGQSDVVFTYITTDNDLYIRNQRERYTTPYLLAEDIRPNYIISRFGMSELRRLQWELSLDRFRIGG